MSTLQGRIIDDIVEEGDYIKSGDPLVHISDSARMEIKTKLRAEEVAWVWQQHALPGANGSMHSDDPLNLPNIGCEVGYEFQGVETIWDGKITRIEGTGIDRDTRTFPCRILIEEPQKTRVSQSASGRSAVSPPTLLSGMFVNVRIPVKSPQQLLQIPIEAIRPGDRIWINRGGKLQILKTRIANMQGEHALIRANDTDLQDDDRVIVSPLTSVRNGMKVREAGGKTSETELVAEHDADATVETSAKESAQ